MNFAACKKIALERVYMCVAAKECKKCALSNQKGIQVQQSLDSGAECVSDVNHVKDLM